MAGAAIRCKILALGRELGDAFLQAPMWGVIVLECLKHFVQASPWWWALSAWRWRSLWLWMVLLARSLAKPSFQVKSFIVLEVTIDRLAFWVMKWFAAKKENSQEHFQSTKVIKSHCIQRPFYWVHRFHRFKASRLGWAALACHGCLVESWRRGERAGGWLVWANEGIQEFSVEFGISLWWVVVLAMHECTCLRRVCC